MQNLINDLEGANRMFEDTDITPQPLIYSTPYKKKPLFEKNKKIVCSNFTLTSSTNSNNCEKLLEQSQENEIAIDGDVVSTSSMQERKNCNLKVKNYMKKSCQTDASQSIQKNSGVLKRQSPQVKIIINL